MVVKMEPRFPVDNSGVSSVEFALIAPFVLALLLIMIDLGFAIHQRMTMSYILRLGAEAAMRGGGDEIVSATLRQAIEDHALSRMDGLEIKTPPDRVCICPGANETASPCDQPCSLGRSPDVFLEFTASLPYRSILMGSNLDINLHSALRIQVVSASP